MTARDLAVVPIVVAFVACVVVPPPQNAQQRQPPPPVAGGQYGGATYGVASCNGAFGGNSYGGAAYGGATCHSWFTDSMPGQVPANSIDVTAVVADSGRHCGVMSMSACRPAIGATITLVNGATGASMSGKVEPSGHFVFGGITPGPYRIRIEYLGIALESAVTVDASVSRFGTPVGAVLSPSDFR